jgi:choline dehydrogenase
LTQAFVAAGESLGLKRLGDVNGASQDGIALTHVNQRRGRRWSAADAFLRPALKRKNLTVQTECLVRGITFEGRKAAGVAYARDGATVHARARREIILCAGAIGSPQILMLSGAGPAAALSTLGISIVADLSGVGQNLQDHVTSGVSYESRQAVSLAGAETLGNLARYLVLGRGPLTSNVGEALAFIRSRDDLAAPDLELIFAPTYFIEHGAGNPPGHGFTLGTILLRPEKPRINHIAQQGSRRRAGDPAQLSGDTRRSRHADRGITLRTPAHRRRLLCALPRRRDFAGAERHRG